MVEVHSRIRVPSAVKSSTSILDPTGPALSGSHGMDSTDVAPVRRDNVGSRLNTRKRRRAGGARVGSYRWSVLPVDAMSTQMENGGSRLNARFGSLSRR
jgi:hypothetical protein